MCLLTQYYYNSYLHIIATYTYLYCYPDADDTNSRDWVEYDDVSMTPLLRYPYSVYPYRTHQ